VRLITLAGVDPVGVDVDVDLDVDLHLDALVGAGAERWVS
jgi:hypothetical protein